MEKLIDTEHEREIGNGRLQLADIPARSSKKGFRDRKVKQLLR